MSKNDVLTMRTDSYEEDIAFVIYEHFRAIGAHEAVQSLSCQKCRHHTHPDETKRTLFLVHAPQRIFRTFPVWEHHIGSW